MNRSLRVSLSSLLIALSLIPALAVGSVLGWGIFRQERNHVLQLERQVTNQGAAMIGDYLVGAESELYNLIQSSDLRSGDSLAREAVLSKALFYHGTFDELALTDSTGREITRVSRLGTIPSSQLANFSAAPIFTEPMRSNKTYFQGFEVSQVNGETLLLMSVPTLSAQTGKPDGVLLSRVRMRQVFERVTSLPLGTSGTLMVLNSSDQLIAHPNLESIGAISTVALPADGIATGVSGEQVLQVRRPLTVGNLSTTIAAELPLSEADANLRQSLVLAGMLLLVVSMVAAAFCIAAVNRIARPIRDLAAATQRLSAGDTTGQVNVTRQDEIGALQRDFNQMVSDLRTQRESINERTIALQSSLNRQRDLLETVAQLSAPLLPVWDGVVVLPIVGHVDAQRGAALTNTLIEGVVQRRSHVAILDITGLATINDEVIATLMRAAQLVELLGAHPMLAGVSASFAYRIVATDMGLHNLDSYRDLQSAAEAAVMRLQDTQERTLR